MQSLQLIKTDSGQNETPQRHINLMHPMFISQPNANVVLNEATIDNKKTLFQRQIDQDQEQSQSGGESSSSLLEQVKLENKVQVHQLRLQNASLRLDKQKLRARVDKLTNKVATMIAEIESQKALKNRLGDEVERLQDLALTQQKLLLAKKSLRLSS